MKGLIVKSNLAGEKETLKVAIPEGLVDVGLNITRYDGAYWSVGGLKMPEGIHFGWKGGALKPGDEIEVEFADIENTAPCEHQESHASLKERMMEVAKNNDDAEAWQRKLDRYHRLKAILEVKD